MTTTVRAVYENGVLRPERALPLAEGQSVDVTVATVQPPEQAIGEDEATRRIKSAKTLEEWIEATKLLPSDDGGYDIIEALNANRIWSGDKPLIP